MDEVLGQLIPTKLSRKLMGWAASVHLPSGTNVRCDLWIGEGGTVSMMLAYARAVVQRVGERELEIRRYIAESYKDGFDEETQSLSQEELLESLSGPLIDVMVSLYGPGARLYYGSTFLSVYSNVIVVSLDENLEIVGTHLE